MDLDLPDLSTFEYGPLEDIGVIDTASVSSLESLSISEVLGEDPWIASTPDRKEHVSTKVRSWETFYDKKFHEPRTVYISEGGPRLFDALLDANHKNSTKGQDPGRVVNGDKLYVCLLQLGLGWESILYRWSEEKETFYPFIEDGRMSGYTLETFGDVSAAILAQGNKIRKLENFVKQTQTGANVCSSMVALASTLSSLLVTLQAKTGDLPTDSRSLLQLQAVFHRPDLILTSLIDIVEKLYTSTTDQDMLSRIFEFVQDSEHSAPWLRPTALPILKSISAPWLASVSGWLGLESSLEWNGRSASQVPDFVKVIEVERKNGLGREMKEIEFDYEPLSMPNFVAKYDSEVIYETGKGLRLLDAHQPGHPLLLTSSKQMHTLNLRWLFSWEDAEDFQAQANEYESRLRREIKEFEAKRSNPVSSQQVLTSPSPEEGDPFRLSAMSATAYITSSIFTIEQPIHDPVATTGVLETFSSILDHDSLQQGQSFLPPLSLVPVLSFNPIIFAQSRLVSRACLRLLFRDHDLLSHLSVLHRYSLFGDGVFTSRLAHALFDPEMQTVERRKGHARAGTSGLKLGSRDTWPPASSELRLALVGILTESYWDGKQANDNALIRDELPGGLSFSIREMKEEDLLRCMNPDSVEALDFLELEYKPPSPLDAVITQACLLKYDAVFKLLLRAARLLFVVGQLWRDSRCRSRCHQNAAGREKTFGIERQFRIESHHFVSTTCNYFYDGVQTNHELFASRLKEIEESLDGDGRESLSNLRDFHEQTLDRMMFALFLRKRQIQVMKLLEEIFDLVLQFARYVRIQSADNRMEGRAERTAELMAIYEKFKKRVRIFITVCRGLSERRGQDVFASQGLHDELSKKEAMSEVGSNTVGQLLLRLQMSGFYS